VSGSIAANAVHRIAFVFMVVFLVVFLRTPLMRVLLVVLIVPFIVACRPNESL
jgi:hypothetical protein